MNFFDRFYCTNVALRARPDRPKSEKPKSEFFFENFNVILNKDFSFAQLTFWNLILDGLSKTSFWGQKWTPQTKPIPLIF